MVISVHLPDDLAQQPNPGRAALEALAMDGFRSGVLTQFQASQLLQMGRLEFEAFLKERGITEHAYEAEDLGKDLVALDELRAKAV
jgi:predicted HTH domain antitoxin